MAEVIEKVRTPKLMNVYQQIEQIEALAKKNIAIHELLEDLKAKIESTYKWALNNQAKGVEK